MLEKRSISASACIDTKGKGKQSKMGQKVKKKKGFMVDKVS